MSDAEKYPKRLIEVDLPIRRISKHARREKAIKRGHISALHMWWARRPLAACRAVTCAALWPDPADELCPASFRELARREVQEWSAIHLGLLSNESFGRFQRLARTPEALDNPIEIREALLDLISDFADWSNCSKSAFLATAQRLTSEAHRALGGSGNTRPLVVDPFAGGGAIPLEALRVGADAFASDLNPVSVLLNKVSLEYIPKYGDRLTKGVQEWGQWILEQATKELSQYYPIDPDGASPVAYLWARTLKCEGPGCGVEIPLMNQRLISKRRGVGVELLCSDTEIAIKVVSGAPLAQFGIGTVNNGKVTCPQCNFTIPAERYRERARLGHVGERHFCTVLAFADGSRRYRDPSAADSAALESAKTRLEEVLRLADTGQMSPVPTEPLSATEPRRLNVINYGFNTWGKLFNQRQQLAWTTLTAVQQAAWLRIAETIGDAGLAEAVSTVLAVTLSNMLQYNCNMSTWLSDGMISVFIQSSSIPMRADYAEANPLMHRLVGGLRYQLSRTAETINDLATTFNLPGVVAHRSATDQVLPDGSAAALITDPPYYFAIPYAELSDFFYVWLRRFLRPMHADLLREDVTPKGKEAIQNLPHSKALGQKDQKHFEERVFEALEVGRVELSPAGVAVVVFAHASTEGWESLLNALLRSGWTITASWPIDTEKEGRMLASRQRTLASSVHLVCRPRQRRSGRLRIDEIGDWQQVLQELPQRIHLWMPRLVDEGVVGADAIFACLGPALEVFSRYSRVEKASGEAVSLREYLEHVWAAVAREALSTILHDSDSGSLEPDARLTVMWLWTLGGGDAEGADDPQPESADTDDASDRATSKSHSRYVLEFDAARKIAQGLGANLEALGNVVAVKGDEARLLPVAERAQHLFGRAEAVATNRRPPKKRQLTLFQEIEEVAAERGWGEVGAPAAGTTTLDRVHQAMILFGAGRGEGLKRFLVEEGVGRQTSFWKLLQALAALYPVGSDERRWVEGVLVRKKGLGFG